MIISLASQWFVRVKDSRIVFVEYSTRCLSTSGELEPKEEATSLSRWSTRQPKDIPSDFSIDSRRFSMIGVCRVHSLFKQWGYARLENDRDRRKHGRGGRTGSSDLSGSRRNPQT